MEMEITNFASTSFLLIYFVFLIVTLNMLFPNPESELDDLDGAEDGRA
jgi:hypothetical protein